jgi:hypothetical protein
MRSALIYFLQSFAASGIPYGYYHLFLHNKRFNQYNRLYLLSAADLKALTNFGYGMEEEALRVIKRSPRWVPAIHQANEVTAYRRQPITFQISAE